MGEFSNLRVRSSSTINGENSIWTVSFDAIAKVETGDLFSLEIPSTIRTPTDPVCVPGKCLKGSSDGSKLCSAERGKIIVTLNPDCSGQSETFSFEIGEGNPRTATEDNPWNGITNAASGLTSKPLKANWSTKEYSAVA
jgi:hypothetical protein